ncbi:transcriptional regulator domain-containing protein [Brucella pituitosa]|uniref:transcriptional regulator domain-containing protein n=1 Tax=Brucella pituitosa TaxID=571256 RepID=UPI003F4A993E
MQSIDWRTPAAYKNVKDLPSAGFAWEYLRRNEDYRKDVEHLTQAGTSAVEELEAFASRWGLRFRTRSRRAA